MASILLLADDAPDRATTQLDHVGAFSRWSRHEFHVYNPFVRGDSRLLDLDEFDAVVVHYSLLVTSESAIPPRLRDKIRRFSRLKVLYVQDDYRTVDAIASAARDLGVRVLFCLMPRIQEIWSDERLPSVVKRTTLAGYVPDSFVEIDSPAPSERPLDVGYRARELPYWLGALSQEKVRIGSTFLARAGEFGLHCDIAWWESARVYGPAWTQFLKRCRSALGTESGASVVDFDGSIEARVKSYLAERPDASFEEVHRAILLPYEDRPRFAVISPRVFEAAAHRTALVMYPGWYQGIVQPHEHYIPLAPDLSNMDEVARLLRDDRYLKELTRRTHARLVASGDFSHRVMAREFDETVESLLGSSRPKAKLAFAFARAETAEASLALRRLAHPLMRARNATALGAAALLPVMSRPPLTRLLVERLFRRCALPRPGWSRVLADLSRLALLARTRTDDGAALRLRTRVTEDATLMLESSVAADEGSARSAAPGACWATTPARVVWDHRAIGNVAELRVARLLRLQVPLSAEGRYDFESAAWFAAATPGRWRTALEFVLSRSAGERLGPGDGGKHPVTGMRG